MKQFLERYPFAPWIFAGVTLAFAAFMVLRQSGGSSVPELFADKWMYDLSTQELIRVSGSTAAPSDYNGTTFDYPELGNAGALVEAVVFTCGDPGALSSGMSLSAVEAAGARVSYLLRSRSGEGESDLVSDKTGRKWSSRMSQAGIKLSTEATAPCPDGSRPIKTQPA